MVGLPVLLRRGRHGGRRESFAASCVDFVVEQGLDGVDLDWEYPVSGGAARTIHRPADKQNFTLLLQELREQLDRQAAGTGRTTPSLSPAPPGAGT